MAKRDHIVVGLDIGTTKICAIVAEGTEEGTVNVVGGGASPSRGLRKGVVVNIESTVESIKKAVEEAELMAAVQINSVYTGIAGSHISGENSRGVVALKKQEVTRVDVQRAVDTARSVAVLPSDRRILHVLPREFMVDDQDGIREPLGMSGSRLEVDVHIITGAVTSAQNIIKSVNRAGLDVVDMVLQPLASSEAVLTPEERELGVAMVDLGGGTTDLAIFAEGSIRHTAVLPIGGQHLTTDLAIGLRTPQGEAERLKIRKGVALAELAKDDEMVEVPGVGDRPARTLCRKLVAEIIEPRVEEVFDLVRREIMRTGYEGILAAGVVITGGTSMLEGMLEAAERVLDLPVRRGVPNGVGGLRDIVSNPMYATGVGLILLARHHAGELELTGLRGGRRVGRALGRMRAWMLEFF
ncbi:MAG: cell division protein FtsA [Nitrospirae bacterium 13_2_20CM_62_7]|nr:MAG: cell division protein FtsA [Nitrospirae bacterium 13_2_20CM_62_7]